MKPVVGIICCNKLFGRFATLNQATSDLYVRAAEREMGAIPVLIPSNGAAADMQTLVGRLDGVLLTGSRSNVAPELYGCELQDGGIPQDKRRDSVALALVRHAVRAGLPLLGICRGMQEIAVAFGSSLHRSVSALPGGLDHRGTPDHPDPVARVRKSHVVSLALHGILRTMLKTDEIAVVSLHDQGIDRLGDGLAVEARAPDGLIEAIRIRDARRFALGVQWHPEQDCETDIHSRTILVAFGEAMRRRSERLQEPFFDPAAPGHAAAT